jgi:serine/threonine protein kinase
MNRGKDCDVYYVWSKERLSGCVAKTIQPQALDNESARKRVIQEGKYLKALSHPNLVRGYEIVESPIPILIQETLTGETVSHLIRSLTSQGKYLPLKQLAHLGMQLSSIIHYLHQNNILHLDIKPSNIISQPPLAKLIDLNLAAAPGEIKKGTGTRQYMSPEQARGDILTKAADVWGIGAVLFFAATGKRPFRSFENGRYEQLERPAELVQTHRQMDSSFAELINRCLKENAGQRPDMNEIHEYLSLFIAKTQENN